MAANGRKHGTIDGVIDRGLKVGLRQAANTVADDEVKLRLTAGQEQLLMELCNVLGLSVRSTLNAALRYALHFAEVRGVSPADLKEFPKQMSGREDVFALTAEARAKARQAGVLERLPECTLMGIKLLHGKILKIKIAR